MTASAPPLLPPLLLALALLAAACSAQGWWGGYQPQRERCRSPTGAEGECVQVTRCPPLLALLRATPRPPGAVQFLRSSLCGFENRYPRVCCVQGFQYEPPEVDEQMTTRRPEPSNQRQQLVSGHPNARLLPTECGVDFSERIFGGKTTEIDEYPWLALLRYRARDGQLLFLCGGVLINSRYVLTASHCVNGRDIRDYRLVSVRLGEYNTDLDRDCVEEYTGGETCADPPQDFGVEQSLPHPDYEPFSSNQFNDIALLRLDRDAPTTHYIRPICLPPGNTGKLSYAGRDLVVAGWGKTESRAFSPVKLKVAVPAVTEEECKSVYSGRRTVSYATQLCAGGQEGKDSCTGDSGGPLMAVGAVGGVNRHHVAGVVSYGPRQCGQAGWPGVYTRVAAYVPWILDSVQP
ncbi:serine protease easter-like [Schistocerca nitens]|uniref:serine protease easter-like n=1 Tax=Schistocerca nitens TaxID=7011 RepID=UPI002119B424|nr:serine protease easter-like [Schistocerca nitens]